MADSQRKSYNLFDGTLQNGYYEDASGTITGTTSQVYRSFMLSLAAGTYTISFENPINLVRLIKDGTMTVTQDTNITSYTVISTTDGNIGFSFRLSQSSSTPWDNSNIMLNAGATAKPYEPYGWQHSLRKLTTATEAIENPLYSDGTAITAYTIKGNTVQSGTPTPSNPVDVNGVGVRTENLYNNTYYIQNANRNHCTVETLTTGFKLISNGGDTYLGSAGKSPDTASSTAINSSIEVKPETKYTLHLSSSPWCFVSYIGTDGTYLNSSYINIPQRYVPIDYTFTTPANCKYVLFRLGSGVVESGDETSITDIMLVEGETAPTSYIPYGYKIPILNNSQTTNIYLTEQLYKLATPTIYADDITSAGVVTRKIEKMVFNGTEGWTLAQVSGNVDTTRFYLNLSQNRYSSTAYCFSNYLPFSGGNEDSPHLRIGNASHDQLLIYVPSSIATNTTELSTWLSGIYSNGNPLTIYYPLATPTTETVTAPSIPTTEGANSITVDTTVQPSEFTATWTGWHNASVKEYDGSDWQ